MPGMTVYFSSLTAFLKKRATFPSIPFCRPTPVHWLVVRGTLARLPSTHGKHTELHLLHSQPLVLRDNRGARDHSCRSQVLIKGLTRGTPSWLPSIIESRIVVDSQLLLFTMFVLPLRMATGQNQHDRFRASLYGNFLIAIASYPSPNSEPTQFKLVLSPLLHAFVCATHASPSAEPSTILPSS